MSEQHFNDDVPVSVIDRNEDENGKGAEEISLLDVLMVLAKYKWAVIGIPFTAAVSAIFYSLSVPDTYTATTTILPPQSQPATSVILAQGGLAGVALGAGLRNQNDLYIGMLRSRTVADNLIQRFDLMKTFGSKHVSETRDTLNKVTMIDSGKDAIIVIRVEDSQAKRAADIANAYVEELSKLTNVLAVTEASQRRLFIERQFAQARDNLAKAESAAGPLLQRGGLEQVEGHGGSIIEAATRLRGQITVKGAQIEAMRIAATPHNSEILAAQKDLDFMRRELARLEGVGDTSKRTPPATNNRGMESVHLLKNVEYHETIYELLAKQYELAKLEESKDSTLVQVLDPAPVPDFRSGPKRTQIVLIWTLLGVVVAVLFPFVREAMLAAKANPRWSARIAVLKRYLGVRRR